MKLTHQAPQHGGNPEQLAQQLGVALDNVIDLSSAVSPFAYPLPVMPAAILESLPVSSTTLSEIAGRYYGLPPDYILPLAGSQAAIQALPRLRPISRVLVPVFGYEEHAYRWQREGHELIFYADPTEIDSHLGNSSIDVLVAINPNNPSGEQYSMSQLESWSGQLAPNGWMIIDEAFIDAEPERSAAELVLRSRTIILRSIGKFFGLPGLRLGFALAPPSLLEALFLELGPWTVSALAQWAAPILLADTEWQHRTRQRLRHAGEELAEDVRALIPLAEGYGCTPFFSSVLLDSERARHWQRHLAQRGVLSRCYERETQSWLRIGLTAQGRLSQVLG